MTTETTVDLDTLPAVDFERYCDDGGISLVIEQDSGYTLNRIGDNVVSTTELHLARPLQAAVEHECTRQGAMA